MPLLPADMATVRMEDFYREGGDSLIPRRPGLYVWTIDIATWLGSDKPTIQGLLEGALAAVGFCYEAKVGPYTTLTLRDFRKPVRPHRQIKLQERMNERDPFGEWVALIGTAVQRPLYIGMANDLHTRITKGHLASKTPLLKHARERGLNATDLAVTWWAAPVDASKILQDLPEDGDGEDDLAPVDNLDPDDFDPISDDEMDARLKAVESLLIRMAMPMLNAKQD
jgi:hypothetical protein